MKPNQDILAELSWRGLVHQMTDPQGLSQLLREHSVTLYAGFDPTADSLHVGHLVALMTLRRFQQAGHRPVVLVGGATGMIGDPSGKSQERNLLSREQLEHNIQAIGEQLARFVDFHCGSTSAVLVNNYQWMKDFSYLDFLRDVGKFFPVNVMLAKESVKARLESDAGISYTEFSYMLLQAYDFVYLYDRFGCLLQIGGSDQWGNITAGIDLARRMRGVQLYGLTCPLLTKADGTKMGKTEQGALWLSPRRTSPYRFYQYWINVEDADAGKCLRFFSQLSQQEIEELDRSRAQEPQKRASQKQLAEELTRLVHGEEGLQRARRATEIFFGRQIDQVSQQELEEIFADIPHAQLPWSRLEQGLPLVEALVEAGLCKSKSESRRLISQGGAYVNNRRVAETETVLTLQHLVTPESLVLRAGRKKYAVLQFQK